MPFTLPVMVSLDRNYTNLDNEWTMDNAKVNYPIESDDIDEKFLYKHVLDPGFILDRDNTNNTRVPELFTAAPRTHKL